MNQIENRKKEIEIKKDINLNMLQIIKKAIEFEYEKNIKKLNKFIRLLFFIGFLCIIFLIALLLFIKGIYFLVFGVVKSVAVFI